MWLIYKALWLCRTSAANIYAKGLELPAAAAVPSACIDESTRGSGIPTICIRVATI
jgi:hypothetical protein